MLCCAQWSNVVICSFLRLQHEQSLQGADEEVLGRGERDLGMRKRDSARDKCIECWCVALQALPVVPKNG